MKSGRLQFLLLALTIVALFGAPNLLADTITLDFSTGTAGAGGTISIGGGNVVGSGILIGELTELVDGVQVGAWAVQGPGGHGDGTLSFNLNSNVVTILGGISGLGVSYQPLLYSASFLSHSVFSMGSTFVFSGAGTDWKSAQLLAKLGIPDQMFQFAGFNFSAKLSGTTYRTYSTDVTNTTTVPEPHPFCFLV